MSIAINTQDTASAFALSNENRLTGNDSLTGQNAQDLQNSFLTLLIAQLKNQDPTNPVDNSQLTSQLAQISTVSGVEKLNTTLNKISGKLDDDQLVQSGNLIGHGVMVPGSKILVGKEAITTQFGVDLPQGAKQVTAVITDRSGAVMKTLDLGALTAGVHLFNWDGTQTDGSTVPEGAYNLTLSASSENIQQVAQPLNFAKISGLIRDHGQNLLDLGPFGTAPLSSVRKII